MYDVIYIDAHGCETPVAQHLVDRMDAAQLARQSELAHEAIERHLLVSNRSRGGLALGVQGVEKRSPEVERSAQREHVDEEADQRLHLGRATTRRRHPDTEVVLLAVDTQQEPVGSQQRPRFEVGPDPDQPSGIGGVGGR